MSVVVHRWSDDDIDRCDCGFALDWQSDSRGNKFGVCPAVNQAMVRVWPDGRAAEWLTVHRHLASRVGTAG